MTIQLFILRPDQRELALHVVGTQVTVLASNGVTLSCGTTLQQGAEGAGPPPHRHDWDEAFDSRRTTGYSKGFFDQHEKELNGK
mgnify:FL=1